MRYACPPTPTVGAKRSALRRMGRAYGGLRFANPLYDSARRDLRRPSGSCRRSPMSEANCDIPARVSDFAPLNPTYDHAERT
jgi:hypothetical protein